MKVAEFLGSRAASLLERLNFDQFFRISEPKRIARSTTVRGPPLDISAHKDEAYYWFNFRAHPSTEGRSHRGFVRFIRPRNHATPLEKLDCEVDCDCKDYRYRWAWANKQRGSSHVGPRSLNQAWNKAPRITNPTARPGLCKHLLALRRFLYGQVVHFPGLRDEELPPELPGEERLDIALAQMKRREQWRRAQQAKRERERQAGAQVAQQAEPMLWQQVAQRFIRPESMALVVSGMNSLLEARDTIRSLLREVEDEIPPAEGAEMPEPPAEGGDMDDMEAADNEVVELLRQILAAIERLSGEDAEDDLDSEEEEAAAPIIPADAEAVETVAT